ncbi:hypothetical protein MKX01_030351 [Papaver californicum]|nr:hypothetical protein MKX01_030351 [Papaver californicum]
MGDGDLWCTKCDTKVVMTIARFMIRFEVEDHTGSTVFFALDSEIHKLVKQTSTKLIGTSEETTMVTLMSGFSQILHKAMDFQITPNSFNMKQKIPPASL